MRQFFLRFVVKLYIILLITIAWGEQANGGDLNFERLFIRCYATT